MKCSICPRKCGVDREKDFGFCQSPNNLKVAKASLHYWEEPCISGKNGSGTVFFSGCNLKCVYCQNYEISAENKGIEISTNRLLEIFDELCDLGANNINLVNPTHYAVKIAEALKKWKKRVPVVYNSSGYESVETLRLFEGLVDIYLPDLKYTRNDKAIRYSSANNYFDVAKDAISEMKRQVSDYKFDDNGIMKTGVIVRHLILPSNTNSSLEVIDYLNKNYKDSYISVMAQYTPVGDLSNYKEINRRITEREYEKVVNYVISKGFKNVFIQEMESASKQYIPLFDFSGVL